MIVDVPPPTATPVTTPVDPTTVALPLLLVHVPPTVIEFNVVVNPTHIPKPGVAVIAAGLLFTVTIAVARQPVARSYVMVAVPALMPDIVLVVVPVVAVATPVVLLVHVPAAVVVLNVVVKPWQTVIVPVIGLGLGFTVTTAVMIQPVVVFV